MDIGNRTGTAVEASSSQSVTATLPSGTAAEDVVVAFLSVPGTSTGQHSGTPSGWTELLAPTLVNDNNIISAYYRVKDGSWSTGPAVTTTAAASRTAATCQAYTNVDLSTPLDTSVSSNVANPGTSVTFSALTIATAGARLISGCILDSSTADFSPTVPSGMTSIATTTTGGTGRGMTLADEVRASTGTTGTRTWNIGSTLGMGGFMVALRPRTVATVSGTSAATSGVSGALGAVMPVSGTVAAVSGVSGVVTVTPEQVSGTAAAVSTTSGNATIAHYGVSGTTAAVSAVSGAVDNLVLGLSGTVAAVATTAGAVTSVLAVSGTVAVVATAAGALGGTYAGTAGTVAVVSTVRGNLRVTGKPGQGNEVLVLFDENEVLTGGRVTYYRFDLLDADENLLGTLRGVEGGEVAVDAYSAVKATGKLIVFGDPEFSHVPDNQPDFLGVQITTPLGPYAFSTPPPVPGVDSMTTGDVDGSDISIGDRVILTDSAGQPKESTVFTVTQKTSGFGFTNIFFTPDAAEPPALNDIMKVVEVGFEQRVDWLNARIRPMIRIARLGGGDDPQGRLTPAGVFLCAAPVEQWTDAGLRREVELADKLSILDQDIASRDPDGIAAYAADAGANVIDLVKALIAETGESSPAIEPAAITLAAPMVWEVGTTRLRIINDLLDAAGYFSLYCDGWGQYQAVPYVQPSDRVPVYESIAPFSSGPQSLMDPAWKRDRDIYSIPNRVLLVGQGDGTTAALTAVATNTNPDSPYSYPSRGRWITQVEVGVEAADQAALDALARARLSRATSVTNQLTVRHAFLPDLHVNSVVKFVNPDSGLDTHCYVVNTTIPFDPTALCQTVMRLVT